MMPADARHQRAGGTEGERLQHRQVDGVQHPRKGEAECGETCGAGSRTCGDDAHDECDRDEEVAGEARVGDRHDPEQARVGAVLHDVTPFSYGGKSSPHNRLHRLAGARREWRSGAPQHGQNGQTTRSPRWRLAPEIGGEKEVGPELSR